MSGDVAFPFFIALNLLDKQVDSLFLVAYVSFLNNKTSDKGQRSRKKERKRRRWNTFKGNFAFRTLYAPQDDAFHCPELRHVTLRTRWSSRKTIQKARRRWRITDDATDGKRNSARKDYAAKDLRGMQHIFATWIIDRTAKWLNPFEHTAESKITSSRHGVIVMLHAITGQILFFSINKLLTRCLTFNESRSVDWCDNQAMSRHAVVKKRNRDLRASILARRSSPRPSFLSSLKLL